jgi:hypothetical protein
MKHLDEAALLDYYYQESADVAECQRHLEDCAHCAALYAELVRDLAQVKTGELPERSEAYGDQVWLTLRESLPACKKPRPNSIWSRLWRPLGWAAAFAVLIAVSFLAGRHWERKQAPTVAFAIDPHARQRVVVVFLGDHLDRSERLLVELNHLGNRDDFEAAPLESEARELLASNRLIRQSAGATGNLQIENALDRLERLLMELANQPDGKSEANLKRLREEMNTDGLLFDIRILRSRLPHYGTGPQGASSSTKGASI